MSKPFFVILCAIGFHFSQAQQVIIGAIELIGNEQTKPFIIERELTFDIGDTLLLSNFTQQLERSRQNIFNTQLFNFVKTSYVKDNNDLVTIQIDVQERWYFWPLPIFEIADRNINTLLENQKLNRINYGLFLRKYNFRGRDETIQLNLQWGFERELSMEYRVPYIDKAQKTGLRLYGGYARYQEVNIGSFDNKRQFISLSGKPAEEVYFSQAQISRRNNLYTTHTLTLGWNDVSINDSVVTNSPTYLNDHSYNITYLSTAYSFRYDTRDNINYPMTGFLVEFHISKIGLGILENQGLNIGFSDIGITKFQPLGDRWNIGAKVKYRTSYLDSPPYSLQRGFGYRDFVRGYELYVMDAQRYGLFKSRLNYNLIKLKEHTLPVVKNDKFSEFFYAVYLNLNFDMGITGDNLYADENPLSNTFLMGGGFGVDFITYYDLVFRIEYSVNKQGEGGLFFHFNKAF